MSKVHIALVGGQAMPVYLGIKYANPEVVVFVCSKESKRKIDPIKSLLQNVDSKEYVFDPSDLAKIEVATKKCFEQYEEDEVSINLSGGTKPWTYYFIRIFSQHMNTQMFYVDQNSVVHDFGTKEKQQLEISINEQLTLTESHLLSAHKNLGDYNEQDFFVIDQIQEIRKNGRSLRIFNELTEMLNRSNQPTCTGQDKSSTLTWNKAEKSFVLKIDSEPIKISSPHVRHLVLKAGWFEVMVARMLSTWNFCKEMWMNCIFNSGTSGVTTNEVDIIVNIGNKLLFVECKTQIFNSTDIDKFNSVVKKCGGNGSKAVFVTYESMSENNRSTCERYGIIPFSFKSKNSDSIKTENSLHEVLKCAIFKNNL